MDTVGNHVPAGWPDESLAGSDSEEAGEPPRLKVETKVSVELHLDEQGNHCGERLPSRDSGGPRPAAVPPSQPPEQRKGAKGLGSLKRGAGESLLLGERAPGTGCSRGAIPPQDTGEPRGRGDQQPCLQPRVTVPPRAPLVHCLQQGQPGRDLVHLPQPRTQAS